ncbi:plant virulence effector HPE1-like domain-containing protein [Rhizobium sp. FY34]|uniref:plant virulence effector HPE1-like domain-containing protein n=1 Tax=Rhizobium sp. FY34 TaxID=2562309 RepID=UPI0010C01126|nr:plant virulence effector HPE1-like domain-containing protein [Rhizobium sp. FY34]
MYSRALLLAALAASTAAAAPAAASSILRMSATPLATSPSVKDIICTTCEEHTAAPVKPSYIVPELANGTQLNELKQRNGKTALMRTEAWMGGSPVTFVSLSPVWIETEQSVLAGRTAPSNRGDGVDMQATTSAVAPVGETGTAAAPAAAELTPVEPDFSGMELRPSH